MNFIRELLGRKTNGKRFPWVYRLYVKLERMPDAEEQIRYLVFQGIDAGWFDDAQLSAADITLQSFRSARIFTIEISLDSTVGRRMISLAGLGKADSDWLEIRLGRPRKRNVDQESAIVRENLVTDGWRQRVRRIERLPEGRLVALNSVFRLPDRWKTELERPLSRLAKMGEPHVVVYDVGQGGAVGLHHPQGWVEAYFDLGGGVLNHSHTYPPGLRFCFSKRPLIVLSHWHFDHWVSATLHGRGALQCDWLVPEQTIGPFNLALALAIWSEGGRVVVWPAATTSITNAGPVSIGRCSGADRNESGLAMLVRTAAGDVLLPGDCGYENLPDFWPGTSAAPRLLGLAAPHHGGKTNPLASKLTPEPLGAWSKLAYSVGDPNSYGHVRPNVRAAHVAAGWTPGMTRETHTLRPSQGHVWLTPAPFIPPCVVTGSSKSCSLQPAQ